MSADRYIGVEVPQGTMGLDISDPVLPMTRLAAARICTPFRDREE